MLNMVEIKPLPDSEAQKLGLSRSTFGSPSEPDGLLRFFIHVPTGAETVATFAAYDDVVVFHGFGEVNNGLTFGAA